MLFKDNPTQIQTSIIQMKEQIFSIVYYLTDNFCENFDVSKSKLERIFFELFHFVYSIRIKIRF